MIWGAVIVAAGHGTRFGGPKQLVALAGQPLVAWSIDRFAAMPEISDIVVVTEPEYMARIEELATPRVHAASLRVVAGGPDRQSSAHNGIAALPEHCSGILVHDGARPLISASDVRTGMRAVRPGVASLLATPVVNTIKVVDERGQVTRTLERASLWSAQTPQFAMAKDMRRAHADAVRHAWPRATDDAALLERAGIEVYVVSASPENMKITLPSDLERAEAYLGEREPADLDAEDILIVESFVAPAAVDVVIAELEAREARIDGIDRELGDAVAIRAYARADALRGFGRRLHALAGSDAFFTTHLSHVAPRVSSTDRTS
jgi:2-C-methyl-D-erythritol 4-phosphate cytidylyltransferase